MLSKFYLIFIISIFLIHNLSVSNQASAQLNLYGNKKPVSEKPLSDLNQNNNLTKTPVNNYSEKQMEIMTSMQKIKDPENNIQSGDKLISLQKELDNLSGNTFTDLSHEPFGTFIPAEKLTGHQTVNLISSQIINPNNVPICKAFQVEQRGATAGKQWLAIGMANGDTGVLALPDTLALYFSVDNGLTFSLYAMVAFSSHNKFTLDDMDMEIIENTSGTKYIHIVFGYQTNGGYGQRLIGYTVISAPTLGYAGTTFYPPGYNSTSQYFQARITSDNARYLSNPYITIVMSQDSIADNQSHIMTKMCRILSPYNLLPAITYLSKSIYSQVPGSNGFDVMTDVANYHNGNDSLIFVLSNYPGYETSLYFYKAFSNSVLYPVTAGSYSFSGDNLEYARIASSGGTNQTNIMITVSDNYFNTGDFDQWVIKSNDAANWFAETVDYTSYNYSRYGDIIGKRNVNGSFNIAYKNIYGNLENVGAASYTNNNISNNIINVNTNYANSYCSPKPGFRYAPDSCQTLWSDFYRTYSTLACQATYVYIKASIEGYLDENTMEHSQYLPLYVLLANQTSPYNIVDTGIAYLDYQRLSNVFTFPKAPSGNFYLVLKYYNGIETWSAAPENISFTPGYYDFTDLQQKAYGNNQILRGSTWCIYSGDVTQDGAIDIDDLTMIDNDVFNYVTGFSYLTDLNGDFVVDIVDMNIADNNAFNSVSKITP